VFDKVVVAVPSHYTSQNCSGCGEVVKKSLSVRMHFCLACKTVLDRDENAAALNILIKALEMLGENPRTPGHGGTNAQGQLNLCLVGENLLDKLSGWIENPPNFIRGIVGFIGIYLLTKLLGNL
jgi:putative transposase